MAWSLIANTKGSSGNWVTPGVDTTGATLLIMNAADFGAIGTPGDFYNNTWLPLPAQAAGRIQQAFYVINPIVGPGHTFNMTGGGGVGCGQVQAWGGADIVAPLDDDTGTLNTGATAQFGPLTPANADSLFVSCLGFNNAGPTVDTINDGFTITDENQAVGIIGGALAYKVTSGTEDPEWGFSGAVAWAGTNAVFIGASSDINIPVPAGALVLDSFPPILNSVIDIPVPAGALALQGFPPDVEVLITVPVPAGALNFTTYPPEVIISAPHTAKGADAWWFIGPAARMLADAGFLLLVAPELDADEREGMG